MESWKWRQLTVDTSLTTRWTRLLNRMDRIDHLVCLHVHHACRRLSLPSETRLPSVTRVRLESARSGTRPGCGSRPSSLDLVASCPCLVPRTTTWIPNGCSKRAGRIRKPFSSTSLVAHPSTRRRMGYLVTARRGSGATWKGGMVCS